MIYLGTQIQYPPAEFAGPPIGRLSDATSAEGLVLSVAEGVARGTGDTQVPVSPVLPKFLVIMELKLHFSIPSLFKSAFSFQFD